jgi:hypothetical protein
MARRLDRFPDPLADRAKRARELVDQERRDHPESRRVIDDVAADLGVKYRTLARYTARVGDYARRPPPRRGRRSLWTDERGRDAVRAWIAMTGRLPTTMDWSPAKLRARGWSTAQDRIARFERGWIDDVGTRRPFPHASSVPLRRWIDQILGAEP